MTVAEAWPVSPWVSIAVAVIVFCPGASGTDWWVDPKEELAVVYMAAAPGPLRWHYRQAINALDGMATEHAQRMFVGVFGRGFWEAVLVPLLVRPVWMIPVSLGLICVGAAVTALSQASPRPKQRRS